METKIKEFIERIEDVKSNISTEEATKTALIMPFFNMLGYDVFNPSEFIPEFICDVGMKKGEKVDYAVKLDNSIVMVIEAKTLGSDLSKVDSQLARYFHVTDAKIAILTDGIVYKIYSDIEKDNVMDSQPFLEFNLLNINAQQIKDIEKFGKNEFNAEEVINLATDLRTLTLIKKQIAIEMNEPSEELVKIMIAKIHDGMKTKQIIEKYTPVVKKAFQQTINDKVADKLNNAISGIVEEDIEVEMVSKVVTTEEELQFYQIVKSMLIGVVDLDRIYYRDNENYFNILLDNNARKWICRIKFLKDGTMNIYTSDGNVYKYNSLNETYQLKDILVEKLKELN